MSQPVFKILDGPSAFQAGTAEAVTGGVASLASAFSKAADIYPHDDEGLLQILKFRIAVAKQAYDRSGWFGGRLYNKFAGEDPDYIPMSGSHLVQALSSAGIKAPDFVAVAGKYALRLDIAQQAYDLLLGKIESAGKGN